MRLIICEHYTESECKISSLLAGVSCPSNTKACEKCLASNNPRGRNQVTAGVAFANAKKHGLTPDPSLLKDMGVNPSSGPGTELQKLISWFYTPSKKCKCATRIAKMNAWGPDKCEENIDTIMRWLKHSAAINSVPYVESAVRVLVWIAIRKARKYV
jgi:hypothetical protein